MESQENVLIKQKSNAEVSESNAHSSFLPMHPNKHTDDTPFLMTSTHQEMMNEHDPTQFLFHKFRESQLNT